MVAIKFAAFLAVATTPSVLGFAKFSPMIPNGDALGKELGHAGSAYTPFGDLFKAKGATWAGVCKEKWPGASVSVGAALGDPCCKFTAGGAPEVKLSAPNPSAKECSAGAPPSAAPAAPAAAPVAPAPGAQGPATAAPAASSPAPAAATPAPAGPGKVLPAPIPTPAPAPGSGNSTTPGKAPAPTPAGSKPAGKPHKLCH